VTLEPCSHHGRTGPCADALLAAGVTRVVAATLDPNPLVQGNGIARLRAAGVETREGVLREPARRLNDGFAKFIHTSTPFVTMKVASTLDGRIARPVPACRGAAAGPYWITGESARAEVHGMRHGSDAILVGVGTVLADDPLLTDRSHLPRRRPLLRVVLDSTLRTPLDAQLVETAQNDVLIFFSHAGKEAQQALAARGVGLQQVDPITLSNVLLHLGERQITSLLLEGGATIHTNALNEGLVDKLKLFYAPRFLGQTALPMLGAIKELPPLTHYSLEQFGQDFALEAYLHDPWQMI
jgi:diaminohydroxyphosphoribosylaminopyrimidine deaminase/5-amino-6-(5-phosphoribosylamino)uracil reductase